MRHFPGMNVLAENLAAINDRIAAACARCGRDASDVRLVAVSKTHPATMIAEAHEHGQRVFGESYGQELRDKARELAGLSGIEWHFIGHLQKNKVKYVVGNAALIHSVDSAEILDAVGQRAAREGLTQDILLEFNLSGEAAKTGAAPGEFEALVERARRSEGVRLRGLMTMAHAPGEGGEEGAVRATFQSLRELAKSPIIRDIERIELSMGMSADFEIAIEEGATLVRVGSAIFGSRSYA